MVICIGLPSSPISPLVISILVPRIAVASGNSSPRPLPNGDDSVCACFLSNGTQPGYFSKHTFFDFRNLTKDAGVPAIITNETLATIDRPASEYFTGDEWTSTWQLQGWSNSDKNNDDDAASETYMSLRTQRLPGFQSSAAFQTKTSDYRFVSLRMLARTTGGPGAVTAMFTYRDPNTTSSVQEADFEPSFTGDGRVNPDATQNVTLPNDMIWSQWAVHRLDWTSRSSVWFVDGRQLANITFQVPQDASGVNFNAWSGYMSLQVQWIEVIYNTTASDVHRDAGPQGDLLRQQGGLSSRSTVTEPGVATMLWNTTSTASRIADADAGNGMASPWAWVLCVGSLLWLLAI
ncbi:glycoside hydrolase family 16 protein [Trichoderma ceciliae]